MSEARLLLLVSRYPQPVALMRRAREGSVCAGLRRLEAHGLVSRRRGLYLLTRRGQNELAMARAIGRLAARTAYRAA